MLKTEKRENEEGSVLIARTTLETVADVF